MADSQKLNERQKRFCAEYVIDLNATQAAIRSGYSKKTARAIGQRLLTHVYINKEISRLKSKVSDKLDISAEKVLSELYKSAFFDIAEIFDANGNLLPIKEMPEYARRAIAGIKVRKIQSGKDDSGKTVYDDLIEVKINDKIRSLEKLGEHLKLFTQNVNISGEITIDNAILSARKRLKINSEE